MIEIDTIPATCSKCPYFAKITQRHFHCKIKGYSVSVEDHDVKRPEWCPLRKIECAMNDPQWNQCCCTCRSHRPLHLHCGSVVSKGERGKEKCICDIQVGWSCALPQQYTNRVYINWSEHSAGCEMWNPNKDDIETL